MGSDLLLVHGKVAWKNGKNPVGTELFRLGSLPYRTICCHIIDTCHNGHTARRRFYYHLYGTLFCFPVEIRTFSSTPQRGKSMHSLSNEMINQVGEDSFFHMTLFIQRCDQIRKYSGKILVFFHYP